MHFEVIHSSLLSSSHSFTHSHPPFYSWFCLNSYFYHLLWWPYAEQAEFFPQKLDSSSLTPPSPPLYSPPSISVLLSLSCEGKPPGLNHRSYINLSNREKQSGCKKSWRDVEKTKQNAKIKKRKFIHMVKNSLYLLAQNIHPSLQLKCTKINTHANSNMMPLCTQLLHTHML